jgi:hypothetical protein
LYDSDGGDHASEVLVATAAATDSLATLAHPSGTGRVAPATAHSARFLLASSDPNARRVAPSSSKILTPPASQPVLVASLCGPWLDDGLRKIEPDQAILAVGEPA